MSCRYTPRKVVDFSWSPQLAYVIGLLTTDGCLSSNKRNVIFTSKDIEQIGHVRIILRSNNAIGFTRNSRSESYRVQISSVQLYDWLLSLGFTSNKSLTLGAINVPDEFFIDFLRGHLDGDGTITTYTDRYNTKINPKYVYGRLSVRFISASKNHIDWLHSKIVDLTGIRGAMHITKIRNPKQNPMHIIKFSKKDSLKLLEKIYYSDDLPCLARKKLAYTKFLKQLSLET